MNLESNEVLSVLYPNCRRRRKSLMINSKEKEMMAPSPPPPSSTSTSEEAMLVEGLSLSPIESQCLKEVKNYFSSSKRLDDDDTNANNVDNDQYGAGTNTGVDNSDSFGPPSPCFFLEITNIERMKSAQQYVLLLTVVQKPIRQNEEEQRQQQQQQHQLILRIWKNGARWWNLNLKQFFFSSEDTKYNDTSDNHDEVGNTSNGNNDISDSSDCGGSDSVSTNINQEYSAQENDTSMNSMNRVLCDDLAKAEVAGYKVAKRAIEYYYANCGSGFDDGDCNNNETKTEMEKTNDDDKNDDNTVCIPNVIYFSKPLGSKCNHPPSSTTRTRFSTTIPWALFSFVGEGSTHISAINQKSNASINEDNDDEKWVVSNNFVHNMVKIRHEFGFDEPHPRHGRVNTTQALQYALHVLQTVVIPIHSAFFHVYYCREERETSTDEPLQHPLLRDDGVDLTWDNYISLSKSTKKKGCEEVNPCRYDTMIKFYRVIVSSLKQQMKVIVPSLPSSSSSSSSSSSPPQLKNKTNITTDNPSSVHHNKRMGDLIAVLQKCVNELEVELKQANINSNDIPPVLCHLDLQPQNMILCEKEAKYPSGKGSKNNNNHINQIPRIFSVLDWEESCYADPRFELLLMCRKVVANRDQANVLWETYGKIMERKFGKAKYKGPVIGPIEPWLKLETVHSLITLSMQGMNLGGRSPWEGQPELWNKILREIQRLIDLGWDFCNQVLDC